MKKKLLFLLLIMQSFIGFAQNSADLDNTFNSLFATNNVAVRDFIIRPNDKIIVGGSFSLYNNLTYNNIVGLNSDGSIDVTFNVGSGFNGEVTDLELLADGKILVAGLFNNNSNSSGLVRLNVDGSIDPTFVCTSIFSPLGTNRPTIKVLSDGKILASYRNFIRRYFSNGALDSSFNPISFTATSQINDFEIQNNGKIVIVGDISSASTSSTGIIQLNNDGSLDTSFTITGTQDTPQCVKIQSDGKILIGGLFNDFNGSVVQNILRLNQNGTIDNTFISNCNSWVYDIEIESDNKILLVGLFSSYTGLSAPKIARINVDGSLDSTFNPGSGVGNFYIYRIKENSDSKIYIGGSFSVYNGSNATSVARLKGNSILSTIDFSKNKITLYPNPTKDILNFTLSETNTAYEYEISNMLGEKVSYGNVNSNSISIINLANGVYIVKIRTNEGVLTEKFIKE